MLYLLMRDDGDDDDGNCDRSTLKRGQQPGPGRTDRFMSELLFQKALKSALSCTLTCELNHCQYYYFTHHDIHLKLKFMYSYFFFYETSGKLPLI
jgi:hypothetical protein